MSNMAEYALIFGTGISDEWVEKRLKAVANLKAWLKNLTPVSAISAAATLSSSIAGGTSLTGELANVGEEMIREFASSFVRTGDDGELQIKVMIAAAAIDAIKDVPSPGSWTTEDALAASFWSALSHQRPVSQAKVEKLRQDLLNASRTRVLQAADAGRKRRPVPPIGDVNIDQESNPGAKVNSAFSRAVEPMVTAMRQNADLDREELDFLWWLLSDRSEILDAPLASLSVPLRAVAAALDAAAKLRRLPADAHRNIVLRKVVDGDRISLADLINEVGDRREKLAAGFGAFTGDAPAVFPLLTAISTGNCDGPLADVQLGASEWGARALLEGSIYHLSVRAANGS